MNYRKEYHKTEQIFPNTYENIKESFEKEHHLKRKRIAYKEVIYPMRENLKIIEHAQCVIFGSTPHIPNANPEESMAKVKEFVLIKNALQACSLPYEDEYYIYPEIMNSVLHEIKVSMKIFELCKSWDKNKDIKEKTNKKHICESTEGSLIKIANHSPLSKLVS